MAHIWICKLCGNHNGWDDEKEPWKCQCGHYAEDINNYQDEELKDSILEYDDCIPTSCNDEHGIWYPLNVKPSNPYKQSN